MSKTRRAQGEGNIRKLTVTSKGKQYSYWQGRITTDAIDRKTGKHIIRNVTGKTQREVVQKLHEIAVNQDEKATANGRIKLSAWLDIWAKNYLVAVKPSTKRLYEQKIRLYINPELGNVRLCDLTGLMIQVGTGRGTAVYSIQSYEGRKASLCISNSTENISYARRSDCRIC